MLEKVNPRLVTTAAALLAGLAANKIISATWRKATGRPAPTDEGPELELKEAIAFALLSGAVIALARLIAERGATKFVAGRIAKDAP